MPFTARTWSEIRARLAEKYESIPWWTPEEALIAFNEGLRLLNLLTGRWKERETTVTVANQYLYTASASMLFKMRVTVSNLPLSPSSRFDLDHARPRWRSETTTTGGDVPTRPMMWVPISVRSFYIWPADAVGGLTLILDGVSATPVLVEDGDTLDCGDELLNVLLGYALRSLSLSKGGQFFAATQGYWKDFLAAAAEENGQIKTSQVYRRLMGLDRRDLKPFRGAPVLNVSADGAELKPRARTEYVG